MKTRKYLQERLSVWENTCKALYYTAVTKIKTDASTIGSEVAINEGSCLVTFSKKTLIVKKNDSNNKKQLVALEWPHVIIQSI